MTIIDIIILVFLCWFGYRGFKNGLIFEIASIAALVLGCWVAHHFAESIAIRFTGTSLAKPVAFVFILTIVMILVRIAGSVASRIVKLVIPGFIDHFFGLLFGVFKVAIVCSVILYAFNSIDRREIILKKEFKEKSFSFRYIEPIVPGALRWHEQLQEENNQPTTISHS
ncbi:MAG: CvpA family protein [Bacteroidales bacterium]|nr:CvpA family protein [Bacteroidales bacterium]MBO7648854.1 CvpA family protein [Bacteroidales bacterium]MCR4858455.1 CvpA family protein [Bacteroidales bacterium]